MTDDDPPEDIDVEPEPAPRPFESVYVDPALVAGPPPGAQQGRPWPRPPRQPPAKVPDPITGELVPRPQTPEEKKEMRIRRRMSREQRAAEHIAKLDRQNRIAASRIMSHVFAASEIPDTGERPEGWSERKWRTARDARANSREAPAYIQHAARILESFRRSEAMEQTGGPPPQLNCEIQVNVTNTYNYDTVDVKD